MTFRKFFLALLFFIAIGSLFLQFKYFQGVEFKFVQSPDLPDAYVDNFFAIKMGKEGFPEFQLESIYLLHYPNDNSVHLKEPFITLYQKDTSPWKVNAVTGIVYPDLNTAKLIGQIRAHQAAGKTNSEILVLTNEATIYTDTKIVMTDQQSTAKDLQWAKPFITFYEKDSSPPWKVNAKKSKIYFDLNKLELIDQVEVIQAAGKKNLETRLLTNEATIYTDTKIVTTNKPVTLLRPGLRIQSIGVHANMKEDEVTLSSNAQVYYNDKKANAAEAHQAGS